MTMARSEVLSVERRRRWSRSEEERLHVTLRGFAGPQLLATILFDKFAQHLPLNRKRCLEPTFRRAA